MYNRKGAIQNLATVLVDGWRRHELTPESVQSMFERDARQHLEYAVTFFGADGEHAYELAEDGAKDAFESLGPELVRLLKAMDSCAVSRKTQAQAMTEALNLAYDVIETMGIEATEAEEVA